MFILFYFMLRILQLKCYKSSSKGTNSMITGQCIWRFRSNKSTRTNCAAFIEFGGQQVKNLNLPTDSEMWSFLVSIIFYVAIETYLDAVGSRRLYP